MSPTRREPVGNPEGTRRERGVSYEGIRMPPQGTQRERGLKILRKTKFNECVRESGSTTVILALRVKNAGLEQPTNDNF